MKIDIVVPVYNTNPVHLFESFFSLINQTYRNIRIVIVDDGSTRHDTLITLKFLAESYENIVLVRKEHGGTSSALNVGHTYCDSDFIALMGSDDICHQQRLEKQVSYLLQNPETDALGTGITLFYDGVFREKAFSLQQVENPVNKGSCGFLVAHGTSIYKKKVADEIGGYNNKIKRGQDIDFFNRMQKAGYNLRNIPDTLYFWRRYR